MQARPILIPGCNHVQRNEKMYGKTHIEQYKPILISGHYQSLLKCKLYKTIVRTSSQESFTRRAEKPRIWKKDFSSWISLPCLREPALRYLHGGCDDKKAPGE